MKISRQGHILTSIVLKDDRYRAGFTSQGSPILFILRIDQRAAFFKITAAIVISIEEFTLATVRSSHVSLNPGEVITSACVNTDCVAFVDEGRGLDLQTGIGGDQLGDTRGGIAAS